MDEYFRIVISGLLGLFLWGGTGAAAVAAPPDRVPDRVIVSQRPAAVKILRAFQHKRPPVENSLIRPDVRKNPVPDQIYRHDKARDAMKSGRIVSLSVIRQRIQQSFPGKIVDVRLIEPKKNNRPYIYLVKVLRKDGRLLVVKINAANAEIVAVKGNG